MVSLQFGSTSTLSNSAAAAAPAQVPDASEEVDTVGWGSTTVGTLLKAKVGAGAKLFSGSGRGRRVVVCRKSVLLVL